MVKTIEWTGEGVKMIDQRKLPTVEEYPVFKTYQEVAEAIRSMVIRGAPAIGVAAAMGVASGVEHAYVRAPDGTITTFDAPGAGTGPGQGTIDSGLNPANGRKSLLGNRAYEATVQGNSYERR